MKVNNINKHEEYSDEGMLLVEGYYDEQGQKTGIWNEYYTTGSLAVVYTFDKGILNGIYISYHENGEIWFKGNYIDGKKEGKFEVYKPNGKLIFLCVYNDDRIINHDTFEKSLNDH